MTIRFEKLNHDWNADPSVPEPRLFVEGDTLLLRLRLNTAQYAHFAEDSEAQLRFRQCERYHLAGTNDEGWYRGQCRFGRRAPAWGEFYRLDGDRERLLAMDKWVVLSPRHNPVAAHFLFYLRDNTFECVAVDWTLELLPPPREAGDS